MQMKKQGGPSLSTKLVFLVTLLRDLESNSEAVTVYGCGAEWETASQ